MGWTTGQQQALALIPKFSSVLSLFGSCWIMIEVLTDDTVGKPKRDHPYHRLLFAMSFYDVLESLWNFLSTWPIPRGTDGVVWAFGTTASCSAQGFFLTLSVAVPIYNAMLSLYYLLVINYKVPEQKLRRVVEPSMHAIAGLWAFGTALYSAFSGLLNNANLWCWIAPLPTDCKDSWRYPTEANCIRGDNAWIYRWAFYFFPLWFCIFFATVCTFMVYRYVKKLDKKTLKYRRPERTSMLLNTHMSKVQQANRQYQADNFSFQDSERNDVIISNSDRTVSFRNDIDVSSRCCKTGENEPNQDQSGVLDIGSNDVGNLGVIHEHKDLDCHLKSDCSTEKIDYGEEEKEMEKEDDHEATKDSPPPTMVAPLDFDSDNVSEDESAVDASDRPSLVRLTSGASRSVANIWKSWKSSREQQRDDFSKTQEVYHQALCYLGVFYMTHLWSTTNRILQQIFQGGTFFGVICLHSFFDPLQGFLNYIVYQRPRYLRIRKRHPEIGRLRACWRALEFTRRPSPGDWRSSTPWSTKRASSTASGAKNGES